ncbi:MAG TPA: SDR family oxidoreductase [Nitrospiraceae bacterium]|jgi:nucleoside-diphosphate-sugar epimerase|nr:SDR family oxidoreductase [Nitrospiraceae bacterium]
MKIIITGNMGYVGPHVVRRMRAVFPDAELIGFDMGYFAQCLTAPAIFPECSLTAQYFGDMRRFPEGILQGTDAVIHLAAISNDPMGALFEDLTLAINHRSSIDLAQKAKQAGVKSFVFASSCSVYGLAEGGPRQEEDSLNPLTAYARSKVQTEQDLAKLAGSGFTVTCLRFSTACGMSERLRLDLVLNDFVASALTARRIIILSDGTPWRPLIHVSDMARAIEWAVRRDHRDGGQFLTANVGCDSWNYQVKELAEAVARMVSNVEIIINKNAQPDRRSYRVSFNKFTKLAQGFLPEMDLQGAIVDLKNGLEAMQFRDAEFRNSEYIRLNTLKRLQAVGALTENLEWASWVTAGEYRTRSVGRSSQAAGAFLS